ncbi:MAG: NUDIX domain-containing protein [Muribaculaceae bacterium]|jgi:isopentenyldiphosphate isomerase|nr:NUDIX domain-containing protein [Muribaculaceae bacterium]MEE1338133.1 NUDIX domain-containing protein [Muribaculaceae bacterium]
MDEIFPIVDENGNITGSATRKECHSGSKLLHPVVHLHILNEQRDALFLQKRALNKDIQPGKWDTAVGGHVDLGENIHIALRRETREELGLIDFTPQHIISYVFESEIERELVNTFTTTVNPDTTNFVIDENEISEGRFWPLHEIDSNLGKGVFTPNFEQEYQRILPQLREQRNEQ